MKVKVTVFKVLVVLFLLPGVSHALTDEQKPLVGLKGVMVLVGKTKPEAERRGLTAAHIQTAVELRLRKAGVRVLTKKEWQETPERPTLCVKVDTLMITGTGSKLCAFCTGVELLESVKLARGFSTPGTIWVMEDFGSIGADNIRQIGDSVGDIVDRFINDYLAANPKK